MENKMPYLNNLHYTNDKDFIDMDTLEHIRSVSECSVGGTSGYNSTTSPGPGNSPISAGYSPVQSPDSALQTEFSNLIIPKLSPYQHSPQYTQLQNVPSLNNSCQQQSILYQQTDMMNFNFGNPLITSQQLSQPTMPANKGVKYDYEARLRITEQPVEKFRFRYKSEMHGTHGSLNGAKSNRNSKSFPEVELCDYKGPAIIRCSLFQTNLESPHSHQLVIRKDDHDKCDPHEVKVSQEDGYFGEFKNMGIIHTAKKFIVEELLKKKHKRLIFELGRELTPKEHQDLMKQSEKEAKDMNLNQVRLCFEAFRLEDNNTYTPIASPVYSTPINNRKSAQTGELRITRLSLATGSVVGGDDLILLVEKVSKKNIKVRFFEMDADEQVWEAFASFRESDVHHQYAIVCRTPAYKDKNIDKDVEVFIELVRPSDDERSFPPVSFRYKPSPAVISRKRRRTCSSLTSSSGSNSGALSSGDIPKTVQDQMSLGPICTSEELNKMLNDPELQKSNNISNLSELLALIEDQTTNSAGYTEKDGASHKSDVKKSYHYKKSMISKKKMDIDMNINSYLQRILKIYGDTLRSTAVINSVKFDSAAEQIRKIFREHAEKHRDSLIHEIVATENRFAKQIFDSLEYFKLNDLSNSLVNKCSQTALHYCCLYNQPIYIRRLLNLGCNPDIQDNDGNTALHIAVRENHLECLESFINSEMKFDLKIKNDDGFTPLHLAIRDNNLKIVDKLIKYDGTIVLEPCSKDGNNALHMAIQQQNLKLVGLVLESNLLIPAILYANNTAGHTPLDLSKLLVTSDNQSQKISSLLLDYNNKYPLCEKLSKMNVITTDSDSNGKDQCNIVIKEENYSSSTEDEEDNSSNVSSAEFITIKNVTTLNVKNEIEIKEEYSNDNSINIEQLEKALHDNNTFIQLCRHLDQNDKWKALATEIKWCPFYLVNADGFLNSLKRNLNKIDCQKFFLALESIDEHLINIIRNL